MKPSVTGTLHGVFYEENREHTHQDPLNIKLILVVFGFLCFLVFIYNDISPDSVVKHAFFPYTYQNNKTLDIFYHIKGLTKNHRSVLISFSVHLIERLEKSKIPVIYSSQIDLMEDYNVIKRLMNPKVSVLLDFGDSIESKQIAASNIIIKEFNNLNFSISFDVFDGLKGVLLNISHENPIKTRFTNMCLILNIFTNVFSLVFSIIGKELSKNELILYILSMISCNPFQIIGYHSDAFVFLMTSLCGCILVLQMNGKSVPKAFKKHMSLFVCIYFIVNILYFFEISSIYLVVTTYICMISFHLFFRLYISWHVIFYTLYLALFIYAKNRFVLIYAILTSTLNNIKNYL